MRLSNYPSYLRAGFSLLEMSVVLVIIGLLVGGIAYGRTLIRASELREVAGEYDRYLKAISMFQTKYNGLPGDILNATDNWGTDSVCPGGTTGVITKATCNGDGDGHIGTSDGTTGSYTNTGGEWFRAWQQLADAGFIEGQFSGAAGSEGSSRADVGINVPASKLKPGGWTLLYFLQRANNVTMWGSNNGYGQYGHVLFFGTTSSGANTPTIYPVLTPQETYAMDLKLDDGLPGLGKMRARRTGGVEPNCTATDTSQAFAVYNYTYTSSACAPVFILDF